MTGASLDAYLGPLAPPAREMIVTLDSAIRSTGAPFDVAIKYGLLMYTLEGAWRRWVVALDARKNSVSVRFLYGVLLDDPLGVLRPGSSVLMTWDFALGAAIDAEAVAAYVREAVGKHPFYVANEKRILAEAREAAAARGQRKG